MLSNGSREITFPNGTRKTIDQSNQNIVISFFNGDMKQILPDESIVSRFLFCCFSPFYCAMNSSSLFIQLMYILGADNYDAIYGTQYILELLNLLSATPVNYIFCNLYYLSAELRINIDTVETRIKELKS